MAEESKSDAVVASRGGVVTSHSDALPVHQSPSVPHAIGRRLDKGVHAPQHGTSQRSRYEHDEFYPVTEEHGICIIIYYTKYPADIKKDTSLPDISKDIDMLKEVWTERGYLVQVYKDLSEQDLYTQIQTVLDDSKEALSNEDATIVCILLPYCTGGKLYASDKPIQLDMMAALFTGNACKELVYKPKLFFIDVYCKPVGHVCDAIGDMTSLKSSRIPELADFLFAFSTPPGYYDRRYGDRCWFVRELCRILAENRDGIELSTLLEMVTEKVAEISPDSDGFLPTYMSTLTKRLKL